MKICLHVQLCLLVGIKPNRCYSKVAANRFRRAAGVSDFGQPALLDITILNYNEFYGKGFDQPAGTAWW